MSSDWPFDPETGEILDYESGATNAAEFSVSELSFALKRTIEDTYGYVRVRGELGRVSRPASGHVYLDLKDEKAVISGVMWKGTVSRLKIRPEQGLEVIVTGKITTYPGQSKYQIVIDSMEPAGAGALMALLEERKKMLAAEGLFDEARKKPIPFLPDVIGVVTSPSGAVIRDILHRLSDRFPRRVLVWPVRVQGEGSADEVARGIDGFNQLEPSGDMPRPDLIIVARGGGSLEDLWGFNEEVVARAAAASRIPLISAVGHETDWTLIDHVADWRAPTPTAAAERAVPVRADLAAQVADLGARQARALRRGMEDRRVRVTSAARALPKPDEILAIARQRTDTASARLVQGLRSSLQVKRTGYERHAARLTIGPLRQLVMRHRETIDRHGRQARRAMGFLVNVKAEKLASTTKLLAALSYQSVLERGFALVRDDDGKPVRQARAVTSGNVLSIEFADGKVAAVAGEGTKPPARKKAEKPSGGQGSLF